MRSTRQMSITLPVEMAQSIRVKVERGDYASESEVVREGLRALFEREAAVERWLREEVAPAHDRHAANPDAANPDAANPDAANPDSAMPLEDAASRIRQRRKIQSRAGE